MSMRHQWLRLSSIAARCSGASPALQALCGPVTSQHALQPAAPQSSSSAAQKRHILAGLANVVGSLAPKADPFSLIKQELRCVSERLRLGVTSDIPALQQAAGYLFECGTEGKRIRPSVCLLLSSALAATPPSREDTDSADLRPVTVCPSEVRRRQQRIAEIAELIHVASLLHDDVIDGSETRRGRTVLNLVLGNKVAILAGDFLLARASMTLASLEDTAVVKLMSQILEDLVGGEIMQATASPEKLASMDHYLAKTYHKTASLLANAAKATAVISGASPETCEAAFQYGRNIGLAFQVRAPPNPRPAVPHAPYRMQCNSLAHGPAAIRTTRARVGKDSLVHSQNMSFFNASSACAPGTSHGHNHSWLCMVCVHALVAELILL